MNRLVLVCVHACA